MDYPIRFPDQIRQQLRALRKAKGLTQAQPGKLPGIGQVRVAEVERDTAAILYPSSSHRSMTFPCREVDHLDHQNHHARDLQWP